LAQSAHGTLWLIAVGMTNDRHLAEDIVQEALIVAWRKVNDFDLGTSFPAWTAAIVRNTALNARRKAARRAHGDLDLAAPASHPAQAVSPITASGDILAHQQHFDDRVIAALGTLSATARSCLLLRTLSELSYQEIAQMLEIPAGTAMSQVHRARSAMRSTLSRAEQSGYSGVAL